MIIQDENIAIIVYFKKKAELRDVFTEVSTNKEMSQVFIGDFKTLLASYKNTENILNLDNVKSKVESPKKLIELNKYDGKFHDWPSTIYGAEPPEESCMLSLLDQSKIKTQMNSKAENSKLLIHSLHSQIKVEDTRLDKIIFNDQRNREKKKLHYLMLGRIRQFMMDRTSELLQQKFLTKQLFTIFPDKRMHWERIDRYFEGAGPTDWQELEFRRVFTLALKDLAENVEQWQPIIKKKKFTLIDMAYLRSYVKKIQGLMQTHGV